MRFRLDSGHVHCIVPFVKAERNYTIADLAALTGVSIRTIRYYLSQGLLPGPGEPGPGAHYTEGHANRLRLTKRLQEQHLPLAEIRNRLAGLTEEEISTFVSTEQPVSPSTSALDYIRSVLSKGERSVAEAPQSLSLRQMSAPLMSSMADAPGQPASAATAAPDRTPTEPQPLERSQWERLSLGPDIELHVRRPLSRLQQKRVERLITIARQVLKEDTP
jgi:DNA-binding transcriptional MerR regulator